MKALPIADADIIIQQIRDSLPPDTGQVFDVYTRQWHPLSYYTTNTRGVIVKYPAFTIAELQSVDSQENLNRAIREAAVLDQLVTTYTSTDKWRDNPNIDMGTLGLKLIWLFEDELAEECLFNIERLLRESSGYLMNVYNDIHGKPEPYQPRPWVTA